MYEYIFGFLMATLFMTGLVSLGWIMNSSQDKDIWSDRG